MERCVLILMFARNIQDYLDRERDELIVGAGTSLNVFTLDKQLDTAFDQYIKTFLANAGLDFEEL